MFRSNLFRILMFLLAIGLPAGVSAQGPYGVPGYQQPMQMNRFVGEAIPDIWDESQPIERFFEAVARRSRVTIEYLHWNFDNPDARNLGAPIADVPDPSIPFPVFNNLAGGAAAGFGVVPNAASLGLSDVSGIRGTLAVDMAAGTLEASIFGTGQKNDGFTLDNLQRGRPAGLEALGTELRPNIVTPFLTNGVPSNASALNALIYDDSFSATLSLDAWGTELMYYQEKYLPAGWFNWQWGGGFRYLALDEDLLTVGVFNAGGTQADTVGTVRGEAINNIYGPEIGGRASFHSRYVSLTVSPRIMFGLNDHTDEASGSLVGPGGTTIIAPVRDRTVDFGSAFELNIQLQFHLTPRFTVVAGYDFMYLGQTSRPTNSIVYDSVNTPGGFDGTLRQNVTLNDFMMRGLSLGGVFVY